jgi:GTPase SAR1 family protein
MLINKSVKMMSRKIIVSLCIVFLLSSFQQTVLAAEIQKGGLLNISLTNAILSPKFSPSIMNYSAEVMDSNIIVNATAIEDNSIVEINGELVSGEEVSKQIRITKGNQIITISVKDTSGHLRYYSIILNKKSDEIGVIGS